MHSVHNSYQCSVSRTLGALSNNGIHPTRDTPPVIFLQSLGRSGDGGR
jgi:hypothetical protein